MYILAYSIITPLIAIVLPLLLQNDYGWLIMILISLLGIIFSVTNRIEKKDNVALVLLGFNIIVLIYAVITTVNFWTN